MEKAFEYISVVKKFLGFTLGPVVLDLEPGMVLGLIGPNGAGKTTLLTMPCRTAAGEFGRNANIRSGQ